MFLTSQSLQPCFIPHEMTDGITADVLQLIFDNLVGDNKTLSRAGLVSRSWRTYSLCFLLKDVDLSSHNNGRLPDREEPSLPLLLGVVMS